MHAVESLIFLLGAAALLAQLARTLRVPYPVFLVLGGLAIGFVPGLPALEIPPGVIFLVFLPPLLNYAAFFSSPRELRTHLRPIAALAIGLVLFTMVAMALVAHFLIGMPWAVAFVLGAILAPTDPVAAQAVFRRLGVPGRVGTIIEGESLVNDGTGLVAYRIAVAAVVTGAFSIWEAGLDFLLVSGGGLLVGLALGWTTGSPLWYIRRYTLRAAKLTPWSVDRLLRAGFRNRQNAIRQPQGRRNPSDPTPLRVTGTYAQSGCEPTLRETVTSRRAGRVPSGQQPCCPFLRPLATGGSPSPRNLRTSMFTSAARSMKVRWPAPSRMRSLAFGMASARARALEGGT